MAQRAQNCKRRTYFPCLLLDKPLSYFTSFSMAYYIARQSPTFVHGPRGASDERQGFLFTMTSIELCARRQVPILTSFFFFHRSLYLLCRIQNQEFCPSNNSGPHISRLHFCPFDSEWVLPLFGTRILHPSSGCRKYLMFTEQGSAPDSVHESALIIITMAEPALWDIFLNCWRTKTSKNWGQR